MEKKKPHYSLSQIQANIAEGEFLITKGAILGSQEMGLERNDVVDAIVGIKSCHFYKSMTTYANNTIWQDVYHVETKKGKAYVKFTINETTIIVSFKLL